MADVPAQNSLLGLPRELRNQILGYVLPLEYDGKWDFKSVDDFRGLRSKHDFQYLDCGCRVPDVCQGHESTSPCPFSIMRVNRQLNAEAIELMHNEPLYLGFTELKFYGGYACQMTEAAEEGQKYMFIPRFKHLEVRKQVYIYITPSNFPGFWGCIRSALTTLCDDELTYPLANIKVVLTDMEKGTWWGMYEEQFDEDPYDPIMARLDDYVATLDIFEELLRKAARCRIQLPYWTVSQKGFAAVFKKHHQTLGVRIEIMPLTGPRWAYLGRDDGPRRGLADIWEE